MASQLCLQGALTAVAVLFCADVLETCCLLCKGQECMPVHGVTLVVCRRRAIIAPGVARCYQQGLPQHGAQWVPQLLL
jgi:hypothetical protein